MKYLLEEISSTIPASITIAEDLGEVWRNFVRAVLGRLEVIDRDLHARAMAVMEAPPLVVAIPNGSPAKIIVKTGSSAAEIVMGFSMADNIYSHKTGYVLVPNPSTVFLSEAVDAFPVSSMITFLKEIPALAAVASSRVKERAPTIRDIALIDASQRLTSPDVFKAAVGYVLTKVLRYTVGPDEAFSDVLSFARGLLKVLGASVTTEMYSAMYETVNYRVVVMHID